MIKQNEVHIWWARTDLLKWDLTQAESLLSDDEKKRADRFRFPHHRDRFIAAHGLLRSILGGYLEEAPDSIKLLNNSKGKPFLENRDSDFELCFNLSHSHNAALLGIVLNRRIGIDLEYIRPLSNMESIAQRYFSESELNSIVNTPSNERDRIFFQYWTMKEAYLKATGDGLAGLQGIQIAHDITNGKTYNAAIMDSLKSSWSIQLLHICPGYTAAIAVEGNRIIKPILRQF